MKTMLAIPGQFPALWFLDDPLKEPFLRQPEVKAVVRPESAKK